MKAQGLKQELRLRLLALVLALALTWYAVNPAPGPVRRSARREDDPPGGERREAKPPARGALSGTAAVAVRRPVPTPEEADADDLDWPEFIDID